MFNTTCTTQSKKASKNYTESDLIDMLIRQDREIVKLKLKILNLSCPPTHNNNNRKSKIIWQQ
jgi:hypothetical protein